MNEYCALWTTGFSIFLSHLYKHHSDPFDWHNILCKTFSVKSRQSVIPCNINYCCSKWLRGQRRGSIAFRLLGLRVWIPPDVWKFSSCECCVLWGRGLCFELITRSEIPTESGVSAYVGVPSKNTSQSHGSTILVDLGPLELSSHAKKKMYKIAAQKIFTDEGDRKFCVQSVCYPG
jgi:hypothetical protein